MKAKGKDLRELGRLLIDVPYRIQDGCTEDSKANKKRTCALTEHIIAITDGHQHTLAVFYQMARAHSQLFAHLDAEIAEKKKEVEL